jgi:hypothetical protein
MSWEREGGRERGGREGGVCVKGRTERETQEKEDMERIRMKEGVRGTEGGREAMNDGRRTFFRFCSLLGSVVVVCTVISIIIWKGQQRWRQ